MRSSNRPLTTDPDGGNPELTSRNQLIHPPLSSSLPSPSPSPPSLRVFFFFFLSTLRPPSRSTEYRGGSTAKLTLRGVLDPLADAASPAGGAARGARGATPITGVPVALPCRLPFRPLRRLSAARRFSSSSSSGVSGIALSRATEAVAVEVDVEGRLEGEGRKRGVTFNVDVLRRFGIGLWLVDFAEVWTIRSLSGSGGCDCTASISFLLPGAGLVSKSFLNHCAETNVRPVRPLSLSVLLTVA